MDNQTAQKTTSTSLGAYGFLHCHSDHSVKDSPLKVKDLVKTAKEMGANAVSLTDHGTCTGWISFLKECKSLGINGIPGVEAYVETEYAQRAHLVLLAKDYIGYQQISHAITEANTPEIYLKSSAGAYYPVMTKELLRKHFTGGHVIATSACMAGVIASVLLYNNAKIGEEEKLRKKQEKYASPNDPAYIQAKKEFEDCDLKVGVLLSRRDELKQLAGKRYGKRQNGLRALDPASEEYTRAKEALDREIKESAQAAEELERIKKVIETEKRKRSAASKKCKEAEKSHAKYQEIQDKINALTEGYLPRQDLFSAAKEEAREFAEIFPSDFYIELQYHGISQEAEVMPTLAKIAKELQIPVVATNDVHLSTREQAEARRALQSIRFHHWVEMREPDLELYMKTDAELAKALGQILEEDVVREAIDNIRTICDACHVEIPDQTHYPKYTADDKRTLAPGQRLRELAYDGIPALYPGDCFTKEHHERLEYELRTIEELGFSEYLLIVADYIRYARELSIQNSPEKIGYGVGPGRGSGAGSIVNYLLGITSVDPIKYGLLFERFLNKDRVSNPDIDTDFANETRLAAIEYVKEKYGNECVAFIRTVTTQGAKGSVRNAARNIGYQMFGPATEKNKADHNKIKSVGARISNDIPAIPGITLAEVMPQLREKFTSDAEVAILNGAEQMEGTITAVGAHAAGVIIGDGHPLSDLIPLHYNTEMNQWAVQCDMNEAEHDLRLLKMDFLGLDNLDIVSETIRKVKRATGVHVDIEHLPFEEEVFENIFQKGRTGSVFQFKSEGMQKMLREFSPTSFEDLILLVAAYRPGPMEFIPDLIAVKHGQKNPEYIIPELEEILAPTYGYPIFQEQLMDIFHKCAGFSLGEADIIRRHMSKKHVEEFLAFKPQFVDGFMALGASREQAEKQWDDLTGFAKYAFNKSHAAAYAMIAYQTAYLKHHYPIEYMCSVLNQASVDKIPELLWECRQMGIAVLSPDINRSLSAFSDSKEGIYYGLTRIKGIHSNVEKIIDIRREDGYFKNYVDFLQRSTLDVGAIERLIKAGAMDKFGSRKEMLLYLDDTMKIIKKKRRKEEDFLAIEKEFDKLEASGATKKEKEPISRRYDSIKEDLAQLEHELSEIEIEKENNSIEMLREEKELLGAFISAHPLDAYITLYEDPGLSRIRSLQESNDDIVIAGMILNLRVAKQKSNNMDIAFFTLEDPSGQIPICVFSNEYRKYGKLLREGNVIKVVGKCGMRRQEKGAAYLQVIAKSLVICRPEREHVFISVPDVETYKEFVMPKIKKALKIDGYAIWVHDQRTGQVWPLDAKVSEDVWGEDYMLEYKGKPVYIRKLLWA